MIIKYDIKIKQNQVMRDGIEEKKSIKMIKISK